MRREAVNILLVLATCALYFSVVDGAWPWWKHFGVGVLLGASLALNVMSWGLASQRERQP